MTSEARKQRHYYTYILKVLKKVINLRRFCLLSVFFFMSCSDDCSPAQKPIDETYESPKGNKIGAASLSASTNYIWATNYRSLFRSPRDRLAFSEISAPSYTTTAVEKWVPTGVLAISDQQVIVANYRAKNSLLLNVNPDGSSSVIRQYSHVIGAENVAVDTKSQLVGFADYDGSSLNVFDINTGDLKWQRSVSQAHGIAFCNGSWFVSALGDRSIQKFTQTGELELRIGRQGLNKDEYLWPVSLACWGEHEILVLDAHQSRLCLLSQETLQSLKCSPEDTFPTIAYLPYGMVELSGKLLVSAHGTWDLTLWDLINWKRTKHWRPPAPKLTRINLASESYESLHDTCFSNLRRILTPEVSAWLYFPTCAGVAHNSVSWAAGYGRVLTKPHDAINWTEWSLTSDHNLWNPDTYLYHTTVTNSEDKLIVSSPSGIYVLAASLQSHELTQMVANPDWQGSLFHVSAKNKRRYVYDSSGTNYDITAELDCSETLLETWANDSARLSEYGQATVWDALYATLYRAAYGAGSSGEQGPCKAADINNANYPYSRLFHSTQPRLLDPLLRMKATDLPKATAKTREQLQSLLEEARIEYCKAGTLSNPQSLLAVRILASWIGRPYRANLCR